MFLEAALSVGYILLFLWLIYRLPFFREVKPGTRMLQVLFLIKLAAGFVLFIIYTRYYPDRKFADIFRYYDDSTILLNSFRNSPYDFFRMLTGYHSSDQDLWSYYNAMNNWFNSRLIFNDARTMIRLNVIMRLFSGGTYYPVTIMFCFLSFAGLTALYKVAIEQLKEREGVLVPAIFLMPSVLLWTSGIIKEAFLLFALGFMVYHIHKLSQGGRRRAVNIALMLVFIFFLLNIKAYVFLAIFPGLFCYWWLQNKPRFAWAKCIVVHIIYIICIFYVTLIFTSQSVPEHLMNKQFEFLKLAETENAGSTVEIPRLDGTLSDLVLNAPFAFLLTLSRPMLYEVENILMLFSAIENTALVILLLLLVYRIVKGTYLTEGYPLLFLSFFFVLIMFCLIGWVTPILGAVVRYKVAALPFLMILLFSDNKWKNKNFIFNYFKKKQ